MGSSGDDRELTPPVSTEGRLADIEERLGRLEDPGALRSNLASERAAVIEEVRVRLLRWLDERCAWTDEAVGRRIGYRAETVASFRRGTRRSLRIAESIVRNIPEVGEGITCSECGALLRRAERREA